MTFEPLKNKTVTGEKIFVDMNIKYTPDMGFIEENDVKSAIGFYKKYKYHLDLLKQEQPKAFKEWCNSSEYDYFKKELKNGNPLLAEEYYRDWLFDYSFQDVI